MNLLNNLVSGEHCIFVAPNDSEFEVLALGSFESNMRFCEFQAT